MFFFYEINLYEQYGLLKIKTLNRVNQLYLVKVILTVNFKS